MLYLLIRNWCGSCISVLHKKLMYSIVLSWRSASSLVAKCPPILVVHDLSVRRSFGTTYLYTNFTFIIAITKNHNLGPSAFRSEKVCYYSKPNSIAKGYHNDCLYDNEKNVPTINHVWIMAESMTKKAISSCYLIRDKEMQNK